MVDPNRTIEQLKRLPRIFEAYHVTTFEVAREGAAGTHMVTVEVLDAGDDSDEHTRYTVVARAENGMATSGNAAESVQTALAIVHWGELD